MGNRHPNWSEDFQINENKQLIPTNHEWDKILKGKYKQAMRHLDQSYYETYENGKWLMTKYQQNEPYIWGEKSAHCIPMHHLKKTLICKYAEQQIREDYKQIPWVGEWIDCNIIFGDCPNHYQLLQKMHRCNELHNPMVFREYKKQIQQLMRTAQKLNRTRVYSQAVRYYYQAMKRSNEIVWSDPEKKFHLQTNAYKSMIDIASK